LGFDSSPSLTRSTPASACFLTTSATAERTRAARAAGSTGTPSSLAYIIRIRSSGRGRLPVCVVRKRWVLRFMALAPKRTLKQHDQPIYGAACEIAVEFDLVGVFS